MTRSWQQSLKQALYAKARSNRGETLTEVLVSIVIAGLAILMLAMAISAATSSNLHSQKAIDEYFQESNGIATSSTNNGTGSVSLKTSGGVTVHLNDENSVNYHIGLEDGATPVASYNVGP